MPGAITFMSKGRIMQALDEHLKAPRREQLDEVRAGGSLSALGLETSVLRNSQRPHIDDEVLGSGDEAYWAYHQNKAEIIRGAYIQALEMALGIDRPNPPNPPKPIVSYWIQGLDTFEMIVSETPREVQVFMCTPPDRAAAVPPAPADVDESLWIVAGEPRVDAVRDRMASGNYEIEDKKPIDGAPGAFSQRLKGY